MLVTRYLVKNLLSVTVFVALTLTMVIWLTQSLKLLELVANSEAPPGIFLKLVALTLPRFLEVILPLSLVIAVLFVYNKLILDNELVVLRSCGFDQMALAKPALLLAAGMTVLLLFMTTWLSPESYARMQSLRQMVKAEYSTFLLREGVFNTFGKSLTVYLRARGQDGALLGLVIHDTRDRNKPPVTITAKKGIVVAENDVPSIIVYDGMRQQLDPETGTASRLYFSKYTIEITGFENDTPLRWREASERTVAELLNPDMTNRRDVSNRDLFLAEANHRLVTPFNALGFTLIALTCILLGPFNRRGQNKKVLLAALLVILAEAFNLSIVNFAKKHIEALPLLYAATSLPLVCGFWLLGLQGEQQLKALLKRWKPVEAAA